MANVYGPRQDPHGEAGVISIFCGVSAEGGRATVYGSGRQTRDYVFIDDAVAAWLAAAEADVTGALNVSTGVETSVLDVLARARAPARPRAGPRRRDRALVPGPVGRRGGSSAGRRGCRSPTGCAGRSARSPRRG